MFRIVPQLTASRITESIEFYTVRLGFSVTQLDPPDSPEFAALEREEQSLFLVADRARREVNQNELADNRRGVGVRLYFEVDDAAEVFTGLEKSGVQIVRGLTANEAEQYTEFVIADPDGYEIGIYS